MVPLKLEQMVPGRHLDERGQVPAGSDRDDRQRDLDTDDVEELLFDAEPVVFLLRVPLDQLDHQLDLLALADGRDAEQVLDVDDAETANLHVMLDDRVASTEDRLVLPPADVDDIVGDETV